MTLRAFIATSEKDRSDLYRLRYRVFTSEQSKYTDIADHAGGRLVDAFDEVATHIAVADEGRIVGGLRQIRGRRHASKSMIQRLGLDHLRHLADHEFGFSGRLCIEPSYRGSRALLRLLEANYLSARDEGVRFDFIFCNPHIVEQYEALGYRRYHRYYSDPQLGYQSPMILDGCDSAYLESIRSPFARHAAQRSSLCADDVVSGLLMPNLRLDQVRRRDLMARCESVWTPTVRRVMEQLLGSAIVIQCSSGDNVTPIGTPGRELFLLMSGRLEGRTVGGVATDMSVGDFFGQEALLSRGSHEQFAVAAGDVEILVFSDRQLAQFARQAPGEWNEFVRDLLRASTRKDGEVPEREALAR